MSGFHTEIIQTTFSKKAFPLRGVCFQLVLGSHLVWLGAAKECQLAEQSAAVFEALSPIYQETLDLTAEDRSLVDLSVEKLYFGGYKVKCFELHSLLTNVNSHKFKASVLSMARTVLKLSHELDETNIEFINKGINLLADFNNIQAKPATLGAAVSALGKTFEELWLEQDGPRIF